MQQTHTMQSWLTGDRANTPGAALARAGLAGDGLAKQIFFTDILAEADYLMTSVKVGDVIFVWTCTHFYIGEVEFVDATVIVLKKGACWVPQVGRLYRAFETGTPEEVEPLNVRVHVVASSVVVVYDWPFPIPTQPTTPADN